MDRPLPLRDRRRRLGQLDDFAGQEWLRRLDDLVRPVDRLHEDELLVLTEPCVVHTEAAIPEGLPQLVVVGPQARPGLGKLQLARSVFEDAPGFGQVVLVVGAHQGQGQDGYVHAGVW